MISETFWLKHPNGSEWPIKLEVEHYLIEDCGIGPYEYWGFQGTQSDLQITKVDFEIDWTKSDAEALKFFSPKQIMNRAKMDSEFWERVSEEIWTQHLLQEVP